MLKMLKINTALLGLFILLGVGQTTLATEYYIAPTGSDNPDCTLDNPCKNITHASAKLQAGDILYIRGGTYAGQGGLRWSFSGTKDKPIVIKNYQNEKPVFDGKGSGSNFVTIVGSDWLVIDGLEIKDYKGYGGIWIGYSGSGSDYAEHNIIKNCIFRDLGEKEYHHHAIYLSYGNKDIDIYDNLIINPAGGGIHAWHGPGVKGSKIYNNIIIGAHWGIILADGAEDIGIYNNVIYDCRIAMDFSYGGEGEDSGRGVKNVILKNNIIIGNNKNFVIGSINANDITADYNIYYDPQEISGKGSHSLAVNPLFVDLGNNDFHLKSTSPAIGAGVSIPKITKDKDGKIRGNTPSIGAYEHEDVSNDTCGPSLLNLCVTQSTCEVAEGNWCNDDHCQIEECPQNNPEYRADVNNQDGVNATDALLVLKKSIDYSLVDILKIGWVDSATTGDVNCDGEVKVTDAMLILKKSVGGYTQNELHDMGWCVE